MENKTLENISYYEDLLILENNREEFINYIIEKGEKLIPLSTEEKTQNNLIKGCTSQVWLLSKIVNGDLIFLADSESKIIKGILFFLLKTISGEKVLAILNQNFPMLEYIKNMNFLSQKRLIGMDNIILKIKNIAVNHSKKFNQSKVIKSYL